MKRVILNPRDNYVDRLKSIGFGYYNLKSSNNQDYWREGICYELTESQIDHIEDSTNDLHQMCLEMVSEIVTSGDYPSYFNLSEFAKSEIERSWKQNNKSLYGRFDLAFDGSTCKMLEYNGDTPTGLLEGAVAQWNFIQEADGIPNRDQFNLIYERMVETWNNQYPKGTKIHFTASRDAHEEEWANLYCIMNAAIEAGMDVKDICLEDIGVSQDQFYDLQMSPIKTIFKLYPWEWMFKEEFSKSLITSQTNWIEPQWKALLSNKGNLVKLWEMFKGHPNLLPAYASHVECTNGLWVMKAILGREGSNIKKLFVENNQIQSSVTGDGSHFIPEYHSDGYVFQKWHDLPKFDNNYTVLGSWVIGDKASGMSFRESEPEITGNDSHFASHYFVK